MPSIHVVEKRQHYVFAITRVLLGADSNYWIGIVEEKTFEASIAQLRMILPFSEVISDQRLNDEKKIVRSRIGTGCII
ncbi:hypothetical protein A6456_33075 [Paraburkholderia tropica]|nr:hypothetical protein A6456_33075 [Paraburkholderia tropica]